MTLAGTPSWLLDGQLPVRSETQTGAGMVERRTSERKESSKVWQALVRQGFAPDAVSKALRARGTREED